MATKPALCGTLPYLKVSKSANKRNKNSFAKLQPGVSKNVQFYADFKTVENIAKKFP
jgi:hypothetical protein